MSRSRQAEWKARKRAEGRCVQCGNPLTPEAKASMCPECYRKNRIYMGLSLLRRYAPEKLIPQERTA